MREQGSAGTGSRARGGGPPGRAGTLTGQEDGQQQPQQQEQQAGQQQDAEPGERAVWLQLCGTPAWGQEDELLRAPVPRPPSQDPRPPVPRPRPGLPCQGPRAWPLVSSWTAGGGHGGPDSGSKAGLQNSVWKGETGGTAHLRPAAGTRDRLPWGLTLLLSVASTQRVISEQSFMAQGSAELSGVLGNA